MSEADRPGGFVLEAKTGGYLVASRTAPGVFYLVHGKDCSCRAGNAGILVCFHRTQVARFCAAINKRLARPTVPTNASALVD